MPRHHVFRGQSLCRMIAVGVEIHAASRRSIHRRRRQDLGQSATDSESIELAEFVLNLDTQGLFVSISIGCIGNPWTLVTASARLQ